MADFFIFLWWFISKIALYRLLFREFLGINMCLPFFDTGFYGYLFRDFLVKYMSSSKMFCLKCAQTFFG